MLVFIAFQLLLVRVIIYTSRLHILHTHMNDGHVRILIYGCFFENKILFFIDVIVNYGKIITASNNKYLEEN